MEEAPANLDRQFLTGLARAFGGAIIFSVPIFMTMEMWELGFTMDRGRLALLLIAGIPLLVGLSHHIGFEETFGWKDDLVDAFVAYAVGFTAGGAVLLLCGVIEPGMAADEIVGKIALQAVPGSIGAMLAQNQFGTQSADAGQHSSYWGELFLGAVGALFLSLSIAPTDEVVLIAAMMPSWLAIILAAVSLLLMHAFVYAVEFRGQETPVRGMEGAGAFLHYTVPAYAVALLISLYVLWSFGRTDGTEIEPLLTALIVLGFPGAVGAAAARLIF